MLQGVFFNKDKAKQTVLLPTNVYKLPATRLVVADVRRDLREDFRIVNRCRHAE